MRSSFQFSAISRIFNERMPVWLKLGAVLVGLAVFSVLMGIVAARGNMLLTLALIALPVGVIAVAFTMRYFDTLVLVLPFTCLFLRFLVVPTGSASIIPISLLLSLGLVGFWVFSMFTHRTWKVPHTGFNRPLFAFMAVMVISLPWGIIWRDPILRMKLMGGSTDFLITQIGSLATMVVSMWIPLLLGHFVDKPWKIKFYLGTFICAGVAMTLTQYFNISQEFLNDRGLWSLWYVLSLFGFLVVQPGVRWYWRSVCFLLILWNLYQTIIVNSLWISGWLPTIISMVACCFFHSRKLFVIIVVVTILGAAIGPGRAYIEQVTQDNVEEGGLERLDIWNQNWFIVSNHWLLGTGPAGYAPYNMTYFRYDARSTHNNYLDILAQFGFVGMFIWIWFMGASLWYGWRSVRITPPGILRTTAVVAAGGWVGAFASMMLGDWILPFAYNQGIGGYSYTVYSWIFLGLLVSVRHLSTQNASGVVSPVAVQGR